MKDKLTGKNGKILEQINENAAGADIGDEEIWLAVPEGTNEEPVRCFQTFTVDMEAAADWLVSCGVETIAMEATGIYWFVFHDILEVRGIEVFVVNGRHVECAWSKIGHCRLSMVATITYLWLA